MNMRIAVFASGRGSNLLAIHDAVISGKLEGISLDLAVCDRPDAPVVDLVHKRNIPDFIFCPKDYADKNGFETVIAEKLAEAKIGLVVLAGYMRLVGAVLLEKMGRTNDKSSSISTAGISWKRCHWSGMACRS